MAAVTWRDYSEICFGLLVTGRVDMTKFSSTIFCDGYEDAFTEWFKTKNKTSVAKILGADYEIAIQASQTISDDSASEVEWHKLLRKSSLAYQLGDKTERIAKKLKAGYVIDSQDAVDIAGSFKDIANPDSIGLINAKDIDLDKFEPTELSGYLPIDTHLGGVVQSGNILVMGETGIGKSLFSQMFFGNWLQQYPDRKIAVYSLEMTNQQYLYRGMKLYPKFKKAVEEGRVYVSDTSTNIYDIGIESASLGVDAICVDYMDYLIHGEPSEGKFAEIYIEMNNISRNLGIPFMMLLQPNRQVYSSGVPKMYHARYSGMAENISAQFWALCKPADETVTNGDFTYVEDSMYIIAWKQRFGWLTAEKSKALGGNGRGRKGPGAIVLPMVKGVWADDIEGDWLSHGDVPQEIRKKKKE